LAGCLLCSTPGLLLCTTLSFLIFLPLLLDYLVVDRLRGAQILLELKCPLLQFGGDNQLLGRSLIQSRCLSIEFPPKHSELADHIVVDSGDFA
jgi:hypothetical protein